MSFLRTLATVAVGVAAAKGVSKYRQAGGMAGLQDMFAQGGGAAGMADQVAQMAEKMGVPGAGNAVRDMMAKMAGAVPGGQPEAAAAGFAGLMSAMGGAAAAGGKQADDMLSGLFKGTPVGMAAEENAKLMIRAMIQAAKADGEIDAAERQTIMDALKDADPEEVAFVEEQLAAPVDPMGLAAATGDAMKAQVYSTALTSVRVDHPAEADFLRQLSSGLGLDPAARDRVHTAMGVPPLPA